MKQLLWIAILFTTLKCAVPHSPYKYKKSGVYKSDSIVSVQIGNNHGTLKVMYLGCSNLLIGYKNELILIDPFFSNQPASKASLGKVKFNPTYFNIGAGYVYNRFQTSFKNIHSIFISHSHYDHLLDLPYLLQKDSLRQQVKIFGDQSTKNVLQNFIANAQFNNSDSFVYQPKQKPIWITINKEMRVLIIPSSHAPHLGKLHFMKGHTDSSHFKQFTQAEQEIKANEFKEGHTFAFIVDLLQNDSIILRTLRKGAGCETNNGFLFNEIIEEHAIDLALLQMASANFTNCYPQNILSQTKPKFVVLTHWEDFFRPYGDPKTKTLRATNFQYFFKQSKSVKKAWPYKYEKEKFCMPKPGTLMLIDF
jgi:L-ascorbate metabolism protein UlaG (beta-lactamase superfamily)